MPLSDRLFASVILCGCLVWAYFGLDWDRTGDWKGYWQIYHGAGAWLADSGRDPAFVAFFRGAEQLFGAEGYENFRTALFGLFIAVVVWLVWFSPRQLINPSALAVILCISATIPVKALVQIREGVAYVSALLGLYILTNIRKYNPIVPFFLLILSSQLHVGLMAILLTGALTYPLRRPLQQADAVKFMPAISFAVGCLLALALMANPSKALGIFSYDSVSLNDTFESSRAKILYWFIQAISIFLLSQHLRNVSASIPNPRGRLISMAIALWLLPCVFALSATLVAFNFPYGMITSLSMRLLATTTEIAVMIIMWRGQVGGKTLAIATFMLGNKIRDLLYVQGFLS